MIEDSEFDDYYPTVYISENLEVSNLVKVKVLCKLKIHYGSKYVFMRYNHPAKIYSLDPEVNVIIYDKIIENNTILYAYDMGNCWLLPIESDLGNCHLFVESHLMELAWIR